MKRVLVLLVLVAFVSSCNNEKKKEVKPEMKEVVIEDFKEELKLPKNIVQLNDDLFIGDGITLTKVQVVDNKNDKYMFKVFFKTNKIDDFKNGDYSLFIQNFPYQEDLHLLDKNAQKSKVTSYWINLKSAKPYKDEFVIFKSFQSNIFNFQKTVVGVMNLKTKTDVFRVQYDDSIIVN